MLVIDRQCRESLARQADWCRPSVPSSIFAASFTERVRLDSASLSRSEPHGDKSETAGKGLAAREIFISSHPDQLWSGSVALSIILRVSSAGRDSVESIREIKQGLNVEDNFHWLFDRHYAQILRFFRRKGFPLEDCRDLTQETFVSVYKGLGALRQEEQFESWLFAIAHNVWCSLLESRSAQKRSAVVMSLEAEVDADGRTPPIARLADRGGDPLTVA